MNNKRQFFVIASVHVFLFSGNFSDDKWQIGQARVTANRVDISFTLLIIGTIFLSTFIFFFNFAFNIHKPSRDHAFNLSVQVSIIAKKGSTMGGFAAIDNIEFKTSQQGIIGCATLPEVVGNISP